jgi:Ser/Thr protein kinase RdoA (MazF antagonist)
MLIGIDFDNTIADYNSAFAAEAARRGLIPLGAPATKRSIRDRLRRLPDGERQWMAIQGQVYGARMGEAELIEGVAGFLTRCRTQGVKVVVISHKTWHGHFDPARVDLRDAAKRWMAGQGFFDPDRFGLDPSAVFFEDTRDAKVARIAACGCDVFIDDLEEVLTHPAFPGSTARHLLHPDPGSLPSGPFTAHRDWASLTAGIFSRPLAPLGESAGIEAAEWAETRLGYPITAIRRGTAGGNNRIYRVDTAAGPFCLKLYPKLPNDPRDRLGTEFTALSFLGRHGVAVVPRAIAADPASGAALYSWLDGVPVGNPTDANLDALLDFVATLDRLRQSPGAAALPAASEACLSPAELVRQLERRLDALAGAAVASPDLDRLLNEGIVPLLERWGQPVRRFDTPLPLHLRTLSPSDLGFHNALVTPDGLRFVDFEYFGWDDPVKLAADFVLHPGMALPDGMKARFLAGCRTLFARDAGLEDRLDLLYPLYGLRWCLILLNEFLPERWARRAFAGADDRTAAQARQLAKATTLLRTLTDHDGRFSFAA